MFELALLIGIYSYIILALGLLGQLFESSVLFSTLLYLFVILFYFLKVKKTKIKLPKIVKLDNLSKILVSLLIAQVLVNLIGALGPELSFDALWYHLTIPKIFIDNHSIFHINGNLLYYSDMPKTIEMLFIPALMFGGEILAKLVSFAFGILCLIALYKLSRLFLSIRYSLLSLVIFYSSLVVGWESITAYVDLGTTFFVIVSLHEFVVWMQNKKDISLIKSSIAIGFSIATKVIGLNALLIFTLLIPILSKKFISIQTFKKILIYVFFGFIIPLPWFLISFVHTGDPIYPLLSSTLKITESYNPLNIVKLFLFASDPINPIYVIMMPFLFLFYKKLDIKLRMILIFCIFSIVLWFMNAQVGGSRFILPFLPAFSILFVSLITFVNKKWLVFLLFLMVIISVSSIGYRFLANAKYIPVVLGRETKSEFLTRNLNFEFGDFYDTDSYFKNNIHDKNKVLLYGFHNLYYVDFPFIDSSWVKKGDRFDFIATQNTNLPNRFSRAKKVYYNSLTKVTLYSTRGEIWEY